MSKIDIWPFPGNNIITSTLGPREYMLRGQMVSDNHHGWDIKTVVGSTIIAPERGKVVSGHDAVLGHFAVLYGRYYRWNFWHLDRVKVVNDFCAAGDDIAFTGNSGYSTGPHCHMQMTGLESPSKSYLDPRNVFSSRILSALISIDDNVNPHHSITEDYQKLTKMLRDAMLLAETMGEKISKL